MENSSGQRKYRTVIGKNTFYFFSQDSEDAFDININLIKDTLLNLKNEIDSNGLSKEIFNRLLRDKQQGLKSLLALTGLSNENLKRLVTLVRVADDDELSALTHKSRWADEQINDDISEWSDSRINSLIRNNPEFRAGIVNLFFEGSSNVFLSRSFPPFELRKLSIQKLSFEFTSLIDTIVRYKQKGSYSALRANNPETVIQAILERLDIPFVCGDLPQLVDHEQALKRTMDFIIPDKKSPQVVIECAFSATTSSGQGDKAKTELQMRGLISEYYPDAQFWGFIDGIGWYVRKRDLNRMASAFDEVFTFHTDELSRFENMLKGRYRR